MITLTPQLRFFLTLAKTQAILTRRFDAGLNGLSLSDFMILLHISQAPDQKMRRVDLAEKIGLTASGVTRLLAPMEKIGLIGREVNPNDARVSYVVLASGGRSKLRDTMEYAELLSADLMPAEEREQAEKLTALLIGLSGTV